MSREQNGHRGLKADTAWAYRQLMLSTSDPAIVDERKAFLSTRPSGGHEGNRPTDGARQ
ncbi:hypothetical protein [Arthrobacter alpinus]|uniref:hypothetical protein n=1 Tax=Arthrobacter alpinus TaxID=656366 RepID=UPI0016445443|nr:hypothetical protein [Arthrobacter alpinus]